MAKIVTVPSGVLRKPAQPVLALDASVLNILKDMEKVLKDAKDPQGVGLAAPQIGLSLRIFMIRPAAAGPITTFINPEIIKYSQRRIKPDSKDGVYEGCLSIPHHYAPVTRSFLVTVKYQTINNSPPAPPLKLREGNERGELLQKTAVFSGFPAQVIQHEMDHLNGILFIDRVLEQGSKLFKIVGKEWKEVGL